MSQTIWYYENISGLNFRLSLKAVCDSVTVHVSEMFRGVSRAIGIKGKKKRNRCKTSQLQSRLLGGDSFSMPLRGCFTPKIGDIMSCQGRGAHGAEVRLVKCLLDNRRRRTRCKNAAGRELEYELQYQLEE